MEYGYSVAPSQGLVYDEHPQRSLYDDEPTNTMVVGEEEEHEPILKSVKEKVKKMEDIIKNTNGDDHKVNDDHYLEEEGEGYHEDDETVEVNDAPMYESAMLGGRDEPTELNPNPNELGVSPDVVSSLQAMAISEQPEVQQRHQQCNQTQLGHEDELQMGHEPSNVEKKPSYTEKLSLTAAAAKDAAVSAASTVYSKIAGTVSGRPEEPTRQTPKKPSYTERLSSTAAAAKDVAVCAASSVYAMVAGKEEGTDDQVEELKGGDAEKKGRYTEKLSSPALMREYLAEKLRPGEEDRALCEVISESMQKNREQEEEKKKVAGWDGTIRGGGEEMVEKVRDAVTSLVGRDGADSGSLPPAAETPGERADQE